MARGKIVLAGLCALIAAAVWSAAEAARQKIGAPGGAERSPLPSAEAAHRGTPQLSGLNARSIAEAFSLEGVAGFVEGRAREAVRYALSKEGSAWICDAFANAVNARRRGEKGVDLAQLFSQDEALRLAVKEDLKARLRQWLPGQVKQAIVRDVFGGVAGESAAREAEAIAERVIREIDTSFNERIDAAASELYDGALARLREEMQRTGLSGFIDPTDLRGSLARVMSTEAVGEFASQGIARLIGDGAVAGIRARIEDAFGGSLPPEALAALAKGPEEFERYASAFDRYLPGARLSGFTESILNRELFRLPTPAYAAMLAASAAAHFARAYSGVYVDPYELRRGVEVTRVMVWQIEHKEGIGLSLMQLAGMARDLATRLGMGAQFGAALDRISAPLARVQELADRVDVMLKSPLAEVSVRLRGLAGEMQRELEALQEAIVGPARNELANLKGWADDDLARLRDHIEGALPENFNGVPGSFEDARGALGLPEDLLGAAGDLTPRDLLGEAAERAGLSGVGDKVRRDLAKLGDAASEAAAEAASQTLGAAHLLGPAAAILGVERVPPHPSDESALDPVLLSSGEYVQEVTDLVIPGRGMDFRFTRTYLGRSDFTGELGRRWTHSYAERLRPWKDGITYVDDHGRKHFFAREGAGFVAPHAFGLSLVPVEGGFLLSRRDGVATEFDAEGRPLAKCDRYGNCLDYEYGQDGLLAAVIDPFGRRVRFERRKDGLLTRIVDFAGRTISFSYSDAFDLVSVTSPRSVDYPKGKTTTYRYTKEGAREGAHLISLIMDPGGEAWLSLRYDELGRVVKQRWGDGPWMQVQYAKGEGEVAERAWVTDQLGTVRLYEHDAQGSLLREWLYEDATYKLVRSQRYDAQGRIAQRCTPAGRCVRFGYGGADAPGPAFVAVHPAGGGEPRITRIEYEPAYGRVRTVTFPDGTEEKMEYANEEPHDPVRLLRRTSKDGALRLVRSFTFDAWGQLSSETNGRGVITLFEYYAACDPDGDGVRLEGCEEEGEGGYLRRIVEDAKGGADRRAAGAPVRVATAFEYDPVGNITAEIDASGRRTDYLVNTLNQVLRESAPGAWPVRYAFNENDSLSRVTIERPGAPIVAQFSYATLGRLALLREQIDEGSFAETRYAYDAAGRLSRVTGPEGDALAYERDAAGRVICNVQGAGTLEQSRTCVERNEDGDIVALIDGSGARTSYALNGFGERDQETDALGNRTEYGRDAAGRVIRRRRFDADGDLLAEERAAYVGDRVASLGRRLWRYGSREARWISSSFAYDGAGFLAAVTSPLGERTTFERDGLGRVVVQTGPGDVRRVVRRDAMGRVVETFLDEEDRTFAKETFVYDAAGRLAAFDRGWSAPRRYERDGLGRIVRTTNSAGESASYAYDDLGRVLARDAAGALERFEWDRAGRLTRAVDANGNESAFNYDALGRLVEERFPDGSARRVSYDGAGRVAGVLMPDGAGIAVHYDAAGRLVLRVARRGRERGVQTFARDGLGRIVEASDDVDPRGTHVVRFAYDSLSRPCAESADEGWIVRAFDDASRVVSLALPGGGAYQYAYASSGALSSVFGPGGRLASFERDAAGGLTRAELAGRVELAIGRDAWGREQSRRYSRKGGASIAEWTLARDGAGRVARAEDSLSGGSRTFVRDARGALAAVVEKSGEGWVYALDPAGNILSETHGSASVRMSYDEMNRIVKAERAGFGGARDAVIPDGTYEYAYDGAGRLASDGAWRFEYDAWGRLAGVLREGEHYARYSYDAFDRRRAQQTADDEQRFLWNGWELAGERSEHGARMDYVGSGEALATPLISVSSGFPSVLVGDPWGSLRGIDGIDHELSGRCDYSPYGREQACDRFAASLGFAGQIRGSDGRLSLARLRDYDAESMRFSTPDPLGYKLPLRSPARIALGPALSYHAGQGLASRASVPNRPLRASAVYAIYPFDRIIAHEALRPATGELNLYRYANGDPSQWLDPLGLASLEFDRSLDTMTLVEGNDEELTDYRAANRTTNPDGDPMEVGSNGPFPDGTFTLGVPQFYSEEYRTEFYERFGLGEVQEGESEVVATEWRGTVVDGYNVSQGRIRVRAGAPTEGVDLVAWQRELFIHGGRNNNYTSRTYGCIRARDDELETLAANFIAFRRQGDPITELTVR